MDEFEFWDALSVGLAGLASLGALVLGVCWVADWKTRDIRKM